MRKGVACALGLHLATVAAAQPGGRLELEIPASAGQREIVLGVEDQPPTTLSLVFSKEFPGATSSSAIIGPQWAEATIGFAHWSVTSTELNGKPCRLLQTDSFTTQRVRALKTGTQTINQWWVAPDGKILRQVVQRVDPFGATEADAAYLEDRVDVVVRTARRVVSRRSYVPAFGMEKLHDQFKPMVVDGKLVLREKEYQRLNPLAGTFERHVVRYVGRCRGTVLFPSLRGNTFELVGPKSTQKAFITDQRDLVLVELGRSRFLRMEIPLGSPYRKRRATKDET